MNILKVLSFFFDSPYSEAYLREIARKLKMSPATVLRCVAQLEGANLVVRRKTNNAVYFRASMGNAFKAMKTAYSIGKIESAGVVERIALKSGGLHCILLYGSAARGEDDSGSDFDFLVIAARCDAKGGELSEKLGRECGLQTYTISQWKEITKKNRAFYLEVISGSIALKGGKPVID